MSYQPATYREQGGDKFVVASSGEIEIQSGGTLDIQSGATVTLANTNTVASGGSLAVASGGTVTIAAGAYQTVPYQALGSSQSATALNVFGVSLLTGTTTGPAYTLTAPAVAGIRKDIILNPSSSGVTHRCTVYSGSTGTSFVHDSATGNTITMNTSAQASVSLISTSATSWRLIRAFALKEPALSNKAT